MKKNTSILLLSFLITTLSGCGRGAEIAQADECNQIKDQFSTEQWNVRPAERVAALEKLKGQCGSHSGYIVMISYSYYIAGEYSRSVDYIADSYKYADETDKPQLQYYNFYSHMILGSTAKSKEIADQAIKNFPDHYMGYLLEGLYFQDKNDWTNAIHFFSKTNEIQEDFEAYAQLAIAYYNINKFSESVDSYYKSAKLDGEALRQNLPANLAAAASLYELKRYDEAKEILNKHVAAVPSSVSDGGILKMRELLDAK